MARVNRTGRRRRLPRPWYWVALVWACGATFVLLGLLMVTGFSDGIGSVSVGDVVVGVACLLVGSGACYAFGWAPRTWFEGEVLVIRQIGEQTLRLATRRVEAGEVAEVRDGGYEHDFVPLMTTVPVIVLMTGEEVDLGGHTRYVVPGGPERTSRDITLLTEWAQPGRS